MILSLVVGGDSVATSWSGGSSSGLCSVLLGRRGGVLGLRSGVLLGPVGGLRGGLVLRSCRDGGHGQMSALSLEPVFTSCVAHGPPLSSWVHVAVTPAPRAIRKRLLLELDTIVLGVSRAEGTISRLMSGLREDSCVPIIGGRSGVRRLRGPVSCGLWLVSRLRRPVCCGLRLVSRCLRLVLLGLRLVLLAGPARDLVDIGNLVLLRVVGPIVTVILGPQLSSRQSYQRT